MNSEATPVILLHLDDADRMSNTITMFRFENGHPVLHKKIDGNKIIEGNEFIVHEEVVS